MQSVTIHMRGKCSKQLNDSSRLKSWIGLNSSAEQDSSSRGSD